MGILGKSNHAAISSAPRRAAVATLCVIMTASSLAHAQSSAEAATPTEKKSAAAAGSGLDAVLLRDGTLLKGTISELAPGQYISIVLLTGEARRVPMQDVQYAGPAAEMKATPVRGNAPVTPEPSSSTSQPKASSPSKAQLAGTMGAPAAQIEFEADGTDVTLHAHTSSAVGFWRTIRTYERICTAPCRAVLPAGRHRLALTWEDEEDPVMVDESTVLPPGPSRLEAHYTDKSVLRTIGWLTLIGAPVAGIAVIGGTSEQYCEEADEYGFQNCERLRYPAWAVVTGLTLIVGGITAGLILVFQGDVAEVRVLPGVNPSSARTGSSDAVIRESLEGLTVDARF